MKVFNKKMYNLYNSIEFDKVNLDKKLLSIVSNGFLEVDGCYFISKLFENCNNVSKADFIDKTGYECFVNSIHIDDYVDNIFLGQAFLLVEKVFEIWNEKNKAYLLTGLVSETEFGANVKFYLKRPNEEYIKIDEIEKFEEGVMLSLNS